MNFNELSNPSNAKNVLSSVGLVRIPFNSVNSCIGDMLTAFASNIIEPSTLADICSKACAHERINVKTSFFYIFKSEQYAIFLKMIAKEYSMCNGVLTCTAESDVLYSTQEDCSFEKCPTFTLADQKQYEDIEHSIYCRQFSRDKLHLCKLVTRRQAIGIKPVKLTEIFLFAPI